MYIYTTLKINTKQHNPPQTPQDRRQATLMFTPLISTAVLHKPVCSNWGHAGSVSTQDKKLYSKIKINLQNWR